MTYAFAADPPSSHELAAFVAAVDAGTIHDAASALNLTQSAVSKRISSLERRLGTELLNRSRKGVSPTVQGQLVYPEARHALAALANLERVVASGGHEAETLKLAASQTVGEFLVPTWLAAFRATEAGRGLRVQLGILNSPGVLSAVAEEGVEIGFVEGTDSLAGFTAATLVEDEIVVVVRPDHPWADQQTVAPEELPSEPYLTRETASGTRAVAEGALRLHGVTLTPSLEVASTQSLKHAVASTGFTLLSQIAIEVEHETGHLVGLPVAGVDLHRALRAVRLQDQDLSEGGERFWQHLTEQSPWSPAKLERNRAPAPPQR